MKRLATGALLLLTHLGAAALLGVAAPSVARAQGAYPFAGSILDNDTGRPVVAEVVIYSAAQVQVGKLQTSRNGAFTMTAETAGPYRFAVSAPGYKDQDLTTSAEGGAPAAFTVRLVPLGVGAKVTLNSVRFAQSKADLLPDSFAELDRLAVVLKANPRLEIQINGHTDNQGDPNKNLKLSEERVKTVQAYLVRRGIAAERLRGQGFGGSQPVASNDQEATRQLNRRVEFEILKN